MNRLGRISAAGRVMVAALLIAPCAPSITSAESAREPEAAEDYVLHCSGCHGPEGRGVAGVVPSFDEVGAIVGTTQGRAYLARVPGVAQAPLSDARLARLLNWLIERHAGAELEPHYDAREVGRLRAAPLRDPVAARRTLGSHESRP